MTLGDLSEAPYGAVPARGLVPRRRSNVQRRKAIRFHVGGILLSLLWLAPIALVLLLSIRTFDDVAAHGVLSLPKSFSLKGFSQAWNAGGLRRATKNSFEIAIPSVFLALLFSSMGAYALSRYKLPFARTILLLMLGGNLLPPQILLIPITRFTEKLGIFDSHVAVVCVHVGFGMGFYTFVLHGFMRSIPMEVQEAAVVDGAGPIQIFVKIVLPMARPALAALGALSFTWIFNDLLWAITTLRSQKQMPVTASLLGLAGTYTSEWNVIAAGTTLAAIPTLVVFLIFQRHFVSGLALGSVK